MFGKKIIVKVKEKYLSVNDIETLIEDIKADRIKAHGEFFSRDHTHACESILTAVNRHASEITLVNKSEGG